MRTRRTRHTEEKVRASNYCLHTLNYQEFTVGLLFATESPTSWDFFVFSALVVLVNFMADSGLMCAWLTRAIDLGPVSNAIFMAKKYIYLRQKIFGETFCPLIILTGVCTQMLHRRIQVYFVLMCIRLSLRLFFRRRWDLD